MLCPNCKTEISGPQDQSQTIEILESQIRQLTQKLAVAGTFLLFRETNETQWTKQQTLKMISEPYVPRLQLPHHPLKVVSLLH